MKYYQIHTKTRTEEAFYAKVACTPLPGGLFATWTVQNDEGYLIERSAVIMFREMRACVEII